MQQIQKFNTGDIVRCITDNCLYFTCGKEYEVELVNAKGRNGESKRRRSARMKVFLGPYPVGDEDRNYWFKRARKHQAKIKNLSALQYRLKHKIAARG